MPEHEPSEEQLEAAEASWERAERRAWWLRENPSASSLEYHELMFREACDRIDPPRPPGRIRRWIRERQIRRAVEK
jgi:hypothetical protein